MKTCIAAFLFYSCSLFAEPLSLQAKTAHYSDKHLILQGDVQFKHALGNVYSQKADIYTDDQSQVRSILLQDLVELKLKDGSRLTSGSAAIDCVLRKGSFSEDNLAKVHYYGISPNTFHLESLSMNIGWDNPSEASLKQVVNTLTAEKEVVIHYNEQVQAFGDFASYSSNEILLKTLQEGTSCKVIIDKQSRILAEYIVIRPFEKRATFYNPQGFLYMGEGNLLFSSKTMEWDDAGCHLVLKENIEIEDPSMGILKTEGPVTISLKEVNGQKKVSKIDCEGESFFVHVDDKKEEHFLTTAGKLSIDHDNHILTILSKEGEKMTYKDHHGHIMANTGYLYYKLEDGKIIPDKLCLEGDICIVNQFAASKDSLTQYILADVADYTFADKELTLAKRENRVLFYDKINQIELSAPELKIKRDVVTEKDSIRGVGDVRFVFAAQELEKIKNRFKFTETVDKDPLS